MDSPPIFTCMRNDRGARPAERGTQGTQRLKVWLQKCCSSRLMARAASPETNFARESSPELTSSWFSYFTWQWMQPFIALGNSRPIQTEDLYELPPRERTEYCEQAWNQFCKEQEQKKGKPPTVWRLILNSSGQEMVWSFLACPVWLVAAVSQIFVVRAIVKAAEDGDGDFQWYQGFYLVLALLGASMTQAIAQSYSLTAGQKSGMKIRSAVSMAVFNKLMQLKGVALEGTSSGQMLNLITNDTQKLLDTATYGSFTCFGIVVFMLVTGMAVEEVGISAFPGALVACLTQIGLVCIAQAVGRVRTRSIRFTDSRVQVVQEILSGVRVVKYNGWTTAFLARIQEIRSVEIRWIRKAALLRASTYAVKEGVVPMAALVTFAIYVTLQNKIFIASKAFSLLGLYYILARVYQICAVGVLAAWESKVAVQRLQTLLDLPNGNACSSIEDVKLIQEIYPDADVAVLMATFSWHLEDQENTKARLRVSGKTKLRSKPKSAVPESKDNHEIPFDFRDRLGDKSLEDKELVEWTRLEDINVAISKGDLIAVVGSVGCGKSSLLHAILGEMECEKGSFWLKRAVSYAPQQPWIINDTVKNNILFGSEFDETRYNSTIFACALDQDFKTMPAGDATEIGARGVNLSGGQKARISLARACYSSSSVLLLDDPLAAVDVTTARHLMQHVLSGILKGRTVMLVTHNKPSLELCDRVLLMKNGRLEEVKSEAEVVQNILLSEEEDKFEGELSDDGYGFYSPSSCEAEDGILVAGNFLEEESLRGSSLDSPAETEFEMMDYDDVSFTSILGLESADICINYGVTQDAEGTIRNSPLLRISPLSRPKSSRRTSPLEGPRFKSTPLKTSFVASTGSPAKSVGNLKAGYDPWKTSGSIQHSSRKCSPMKQQSQSPPLRIGFETTSDAPTKSSGTLKVQEDRAIGKVSWKAYLDYAKGSGQWLWALVILLVCFGQAVRVMVDYWLSIWVTSKYNLSTEMYLWIYAVWVGCALGFFLSRGLLFAEAAVRAAKSMHSVMAKSVLRSPQVFFDQNPLGRIMNRFSKDQSMIDELLPATAQAMVESLVSVFGVMVLIGVIVPWFLLSLPPFMLALWYCQRRYVTVSRELKRLDGLSRSPIYDHFSQTFQGVTSVRAFGAEVAMHDRFRDCIDANHRAYILFVHTSRWLGIRLDFAGSLCVATTALLAVLLRHSLSPGLIGMVLVQSLQLVRYFDNGVRLLAETQNIFTSVERNQAYANLPSEGEPKSPPGLIPDEWPEKGCVEYVNYTMAYRIDLPPVLNNLTFTVIPREKVGILGRTGAGKSSLAAALFRMVENTACGGSIFVDGIDLKLVGLDDLRLRLSIIPQDPVLFSGTVRLNLDPFETHSDVEIYEALAKVRLTAKIKSLKLGLDSTIAENGDNFSVGQRQLLCLARSLLRRSKIVLMDETTAAVDGETDQLIQNTMRTVFDNCTVMTIAHRLDTVIDCNRVLVLGSGGFVCEYDSPVNLLRRAEEANLSDPATVPASHIFASMVAQMGPEVAKQLRDAAEAAEQRRLADQQDTTEPSQTSLSQLFRDKMSGKL